MANYKVSYKVLQNQGEELKAVAKLVDGYAERVNQIRGKLGDDEMLATVRNNLQKLGSQLGESRAVLNTAGDFLSKTVESYTSVEKRQVKKVDSIKAHNRDFYKNPVVVASAGGAAAGGVAASVATPSGTTVNYTEINTINYSSTTAPAAAVSAPEPIVATVTPVSTAATPAVNTAAPPTGMGAGGIAGIAAGAGVVGGGLGAGAVMGALHLKKEHDAKKDIHQKNASDKYDPEAELAAAMERLNKLQDS